ncbi:MAG: hypothetical protein K1X72_26735 [Pyrinomonadaceae bacterium]|nr:hypothetical protein [Pyrinomonadaceae bacterium]
MQIIKAIIFIVLLFLFARFIQAHPIPQNEAQTLIRAAMEAMGGEAKLRELKSVQFEGIGHNFAIEQSERPEGPWIVAYSQNVETRDLVNNRVRFSVQNRHFQVPEWSPALTTIVANGVAAFERGGRYIPNSLLQAQTTNKDLALSPEKVLLTALEAKDLRLEKDVQIQSVRQRVIKFTWNQIPVTIYLNADTNLPTAVETLEFSPYEHFYSVWGDFTTKTFYTLWNMETGGIRYPRQWDVEKIGMNFSSFTITKMQLNVPIDEAQFNIPDDIKQKFATQTLTKIDELPFGIPNNPAKEIAPGVVKVPGRWDVAFIRQNDGIVIIEAPIGSGYSAKAIEEAKKRFPDSKVKAVITTSDAFPHLGGVREYAAQGIPIYALDVNRPILERVLTAPHSFQPDNLQKNPRKANFKIVAGKTLLGDGANRLEIYPIRSESGERMLMIYFPEHKLLYASDLIQKQRDGNFFMPEYLTEIMQAVKRENLQVDNVFAFHSPMLPWSEIAGAVDKQIAGK